MLSKKMETALNKQVNAELYSGYMYLAMSSYFESANLPGFAAWMKVQAGEELGHAMKFFGYIVERGGSVTLAAVDKPPAKWQSPLAVFEATYAHECKVTGMINKLADMAAAENDHATSVFLQWFITEQVEEEATADAVVQKLKLVKDAPGGLFMLDRDLGQRGAST